jgi:hypothetical protein
MKIIDSKGRLFGKLSILDLGAACIILMVLVGIFIYPGATGSIAQVNTKTVEVDAIVRGLNVLDPDVFFKDMKDEKKVSIVIRNQPAGNLEVKSIQELPRTVLVPQPDGSAKPMEDPRPETKYSQDLILTMTGKAQITEDGVVLDSAKKVKIGNVVELDGATYNFNGTVIDVRVID